MKRIKKIFAVVLVLSCILSMTVAASAEGSVIDYSKKASLNVYKYDMTTAQNDGVWNSSSFVSSGAFDEEIIDAMSAYAVQGVEFSYIRLADISFHTIEKDGAHEVLTLNGFAENNTSKAFHEAIGLDYDDAYFSENGIHYFMTDTLNAALTEALAANSTKVKNSLEQFVAAGTAMPETDSYGHSTAVNLELGLYLMVETKVPENVTSTCDPFLVSLPMTTNDGAEWNYDVSIYPKNATGMPTLEKTVREALSATGKTEEYTETATASDGDILDYCILSTLPTITSEASYLSCYSFVDKLNVGMSYNKSDVVIEFFKDTSCTDKITSWDEASDKFTVSYADNNMTIEMSETGLAEINSAAGVYDADSLNSGYSDCIMRITYSCTMDSDSSVVYGADGNPNSVTLSWMRSNADYSDSLSDEATVFTYGIDLTKKFSDGAGDLSKVKFIIENKTDGYYVTARLMDGIYYVTGRAADAAQATVFSPSANGRIIIKGIEDDEYILSETATDEGYTLLKDKISIVVEQSKGEAAAKVNSKKVNMSENGALVPLAVVNTKGFNLPQTGSYGTWMFTVGGVLTMGLALFIILKLSRKEKSM